MSGNVTPLRLVSSRLQYNGVGRDTEHKSCLIAYFDREPTDDEMKFFSECLKRWSALAPTQAEESTP